MAKLAFITTMSGSPWGGSEYLWSATAEQALLEGHKVLISIHHWSFEHPNIQKLAEKKAQIYTRPPFRNSWLAQASRRFRSKVFSKLRLETIEKYFSHNRFYEKVFRHRPDVVCINQGSTYDIFWRPELLELLEKYKIPYVVICHLNIENYIPNDEVSTITKRQFLNAARVAFVSYSNQRLAERQLVQAICNSVVLQNPVNLKDQSIVSWPKRKIPGFACIARLETIDKGQDLLLEALSSPVWRERDWVCNFYGSGKDFNYLNSLAKYYQVADKVKFAGHIDDIRQIWAENHMLVLPSRSEGTPLSLVEAMLCGRPAVVTDVGGNTEWVKEGYTGFVAEAATAQSLDKALGKAWHSLKEWETMGRQAREVAVLKRDPQPEKSLLNLLLTAINS